MYEKPDYKVELIETEDIIATSGDPASLEVGQYIDPVTGEPVPSVAVSVDVEHLL